MARYQSPFSLCPTVWSLRMKSSVVLLATLILGSTAARAQVYYEQWIDDNRASSQRGGLIVGEQNLSIKCPSGLTPGLHFLNIVPYADSGEPGVWKQIAFLMPEAWPGSDNATVLEYYVSGYDKTPLRMAYSPVITLDIDASKYSAGLHFFNVRTINERGEGGPWQQIAFLLPEAWPGTDNATMLEYHVAGYDKTPHYKTYSPVLSLDIDISKMSYGLHFLNLRTLNEKGEAGSWKQIAFYIDNFLFDPEETEYEYWIDDDSPSTGKGTAPGNIALKIDVQKLSPGQHTFSFKATNIFGTFGELFTTQFDIAEPVGIDDSSLQPERITIRALDGSLIIESTTDRDIDIYRVDGTRAKHQHLVKGQNIVSDLHSGVYIVEGMKFNL